MEFLLPWWSLVLGSFCLISFGYIWGEKTGENNGYIEGYEDGEYNG